MAAYEYPARKPSGTAPAFRHAMMATETGTEKFELVTVYRTLRHLTGRVGSNHDHDRSNEKNHSTISMIATAP
jgi:hypothetical protein